uniref:Uncharacterized protein n=1 Tax=Romanomermis culicivorax TaxID=13658 RepID=A0A915IV82_ROMCU
MLGLPWSGPFIVMDISREAENVVTIKHWDNLLNRHIVSISRGQPVCEFDVEKVHQDKVATLFKMREVDNPMGNKFAPYISFTLTNSQTYIIDTTTLMGKEWTSLHNFLNSDMLLAGY